MQELVRELFDDCADHYASERETLPYFKAQLKIALSMLAGETPGKILSIGCAAGAEILELRARGSRVFGVDLSEQMLQRCRARFAEDRQVTVCCAEADSLPFADNSLDQVICLGVFEFLRDHDVAMAEVFRVLKPGGLAVIALPSKVSSYMVTHQAVNATAGAIWRTLKRLRGRQNLPKESVNRNLCVPWKFRKSLKDHGLVPERSAYSNYFLYPLDRFPKLDVKVADFLEPLASVPLIRVGASVYLVSARKQR